MAESVFLNSVKVNVLTKAQFNAAAKDPNQFYLIIDEEEIVLVSTTKDGLMWASDKVKLDGIDEGANKTIVDALLSATSTNPVQNKVVNAALDDKAPKVHNHTMSQITDLNIGEIAVALATGTQNGTLKLTVNGTIYDNIAVKGLGSAAYTASTAYDKSGAAAGVQSNLDTLSNKVGVVPAGKTIVQMISEAQTAATYDDTALKGRVTAAENALNVLNGAGEGSVQKTAADEVAKMVAGADASFDTLKEVSDWIGGHEDSAAAMNTAIKANTDNLDVHVKDKANPHGVTKDQVELGNVPNVTTNDQTPTFTAAATRTNIASGDKLSTLFGKIMKWFADLKSVAFSGSYADLSGKPTSLPANGGNADTVDGKHASDFAAKSDLGQYLPLNGGTITNPNNFHVYAPMNTVIKPIPNSVIQSPIPKYLWHDIFAFTTPTYYDSSDNAIWTEKPLNKKPFAQKDDSLVRVIDNTISGARWVWNKSCSGGSLAYSDASWLVVALCYESPAVEYTITFESSIDNGETWTVRHTSSDTTVAKPLWLRISTNGADTLLRLTITKDPASVGNVEISSIKLLTSRCGDQGEGSEYEYPYSWDENRNMTLNADFKANNFLGNATSATKLKTPRKINGVDFDGSADISIPVPTKVSELEDDSGYITSGGVDDKLNPINQFITDQGAKNTEYDSFHTTQTTFNQTVQDFMDAPVVGGVSSVNGKTGDVVLTAEDLDAVSVQYTTLVLVASGWQPDGTHEDFYKQQISNAEIIAATIAGQTALDSYADVNTVTLLEGDGVNRVWLENQDGTPMAFCMGGCPSLDVAIQVRIVGGNPLPEPEDTGGGDS